MPLREAFVTLKPGYLSEMTHDDERRVIEPNPYAAPGVSRGISDEPLLRRSLLPHPMRHVIYASLWFVIAIFLGGALGIGGSPTEVALEGLLTLSAVAYLAVAFVLVLVNLARRFR